MQADHAQILARVELLEHALHETRQRADELQSALWEVAEATSNLWVRPKIAPVPKPPAPYPDLTTEEREAWQADVESWRAERDEVLCNFYVNIDMQGIWCLNQGHLLEPYHFEGLGPSDSETDSPMTFAEAQLLGARKRFAARSEIQAETAATDLAWRDALAKLKAAGA